MTRALDNYSHAGGKYVRSWIKPRILFKEEEVMNMIRQLTGVITIG